jgi:DNA-binding transcriptional MerR regulator
MYKINEIASLFGISTQTVRYYEKAGLLSPNEIDLSNNYRYYSNHEIDQLSDILQLRYLGFGIEEIRQYLNSEYTKDQKIAKLHKIIDICNNQIARIENILENSKPYAMQIKDRSECSALHRKCNISTPLEISKLYNIMMTYAARHKILLRSPIHFILENLSNNALNNYYNAYIITEEPVKNETIIMPAQTIATVFYQGQVDQIFNAYDYLYNEIEKHDLHIIGNPMEEYLGPYNPINNTCPTEIQIPIAELRCCS